MRKAARCPLCYSMVAARELKLVQVHHINVPKVGYTLLLVILLFASCCCNISFIRIAQISTCSCCCCSRLTSCCYSDEMHSDDLPSGASVNLAACCSICFVLSIAFGCAPPKTGQNVSISGAWYIYSFHIVSMQVNDTVTFTLLKRPRDSIIPAEVHPSPDPSMTPDQCGTGTPHTTWGTDRGHNQGTSALPGTGDKAVMGDKTKEAKYHNKHRQGTKESEEYGGRGFNKYAKFTRVGDGKAYWKAAAQELASYAAQVIDCAVLCRAMPCRAVPCFPMSAHAVLLCNVVLCCAVPCRAVPCHIVLCPTYALPYLNMLCCCAMLCCDMPC